MEAVADDDHWDEDHWDETMPNGKPYDHPLTDLLLHGYHPFPAPVEKLILELHRLDPQALANTDHLLADWEQGTERGMKWLQERLSERK